MLKKHYAEPDVYGVHCLFEHVVHGTNHKLSVPQSGAVQQGVQKVDHNIFTHSQPGTKTVYVLLLNTIPTQGILKHVCYINKMFEGRVGSKKKKKKKQI